MQNPLPSVDMKEWKTFLRSAGAMKANDIKVKATCTYCDYFQVVNIDTVIKNRSEDYCLINRRFICPKCNGLNGGFYMYSEGCNVPYRPLKDYTA